MKSIAKFLALGVLAASTTLAAHANTITFTGSTTGTFNNGSSTDGALSFTGSSFTGTTVGSYLSLDANGDDFGSIAFATSGSSTATSFTLNILFTAPVNIQPGGQSQIYDATVTGSVAYVGGQALITFTNGTQSFNSASGPFTLTINGLSASGTSGVPAQITGTFYAPTPEPSSLVLLGTGLASAAGMVFRKRRSVIA